MDECIVTRLTFDDNGLIPAVVQDTKGIVLMMAYMNRDAILKTLETGTMHYYSRSRRKLWLKGETSGHVQRVRKVAMDCDADCLLFTVEQEGAACHEGYYSCFLRTLRDGSLVVTEERRFNPDEVYKR